MLSIPVLQQKLADKAEELLREEAPRDLDRSMSELENRLDSYGVVNPPGSPRRDDPSVFVRDLVADNPLIPDWLNLNKDRVIGVGQAKSIPDLLGYL